MRRDDLDAVLAIERAAHRWPWPAQIFIEEFDRSFARVDLLHGQEGVVAFANYWLMHDEVHILNLATAPDVQRRGHGATLLGHVIAFALRHRARCLVLEVRQSNLPAQSLYQKFGFRPVGIRPHYYVENQEDAVVMLRELVAPAYR